MRKYIINGTVYEYDLNRPTIRDATMLKTATGLNMAPFGKAFEEADPACFTALAWVLLTRAGVQGPDGQPIQLVDVPDFDMLEFLNPEQDDDEAEPDEADPTTGDIPSGGPAPDSTSPEPETSTA